MDTPQTPNRPNKPDKPSKPNQPNEPDEPDEPDESDGPTRQHRSGQQYKPSEPDKPDKGGKSGEPRKPGGLNGPRHPDRPDRLSSPEPPVNVRKLRLWRWRRNPLRRRTDRVEAWVGLLSALVMAVGGTAMGLLAYLDVVDNLTQLRHEREAVPAVLLTDAGEAVSGRARAPVRWTAPDGRVGEGRAGVRVGSERGSEVTVWINEEGRLVKEPPSPGEVSGQGAVAAAVVAGSVCALVVAGRHGVRKALDRRRDRAWEFEWAEVGPYWQSGPNGPGK